MLATGDDQLDVGAREPGRVECGFEALVRRHEAEAENREAVETQTCTSFVTSRRLARLHAVRNNGCIAHVRSECRLVNDHAIGKAPDCGADGAETGASHRGRRLHAMHASET